MSSSDGWHCPICLGSFERPVLASCCGQSFCRSCLDGALRQVDACPMCRSPLLSGPFSVTPNRALEEALAALAASSPRSSTADAHEATSFVDAVERKVAASARNSASEVQISVPSTAEINWASLQCVFYVLLFLVFVFFLRVQEEEFAETTTHLRRPQ
ncbi:hypothetical protein PHYSODRAFT_516036 [Phytophthora sojae]|uniref:RING-type domain-containing protein n=1 Tax=Phytophthora sojae (strain P6497) TaxID=1094619 RepID=G4ZXW9_PHYSP|nr:hypothetical protein PHYSODRAFT_516036 [Phytophthora sojae]EGZ12629.1 hypothetical protein PHYSODRAFT_516036 [Phytophthora sojae]|eukprot:XP_009532962.1 hypothetical protein PHYSODRAFT_516036 [Phytophthora sojae]